MMFSEYDYWLEYQYFPISLCTELQITLFPNRRILEYNFCCKGAKRKQFNYVPHTVLRQISLRVWPQGRLIKWFIVGDFWGFFFDFFFLIYHHFKHYDLHNFYFFFHFENNRRYKRAEEVIVIGGIWNNIQYIRQFLKLNKFLFSLFFF